MTPGPTGGGTTPGVGGGATTPGAGGGRGATGGAGRGGAGRGAGRGGYRKAKFSSEQQYWLGAVTLPWEGTFLPKSGGEGYDGREMSIEQAVKNKGGEKGWKMKSLPTVVLVYDPSHKNHMKSLSKVSSDKTFVSASHFFNLFRIDVRTIDDRKLQRKLKKHPTYFVFRANGERVATVRNPMSSKPFVKPFDSVLTADFGKSLNAATTSMGAVLAREAWVEDEIRRHETVLFDPVTGKVQENIKKRIKEYKAELKDLEKHKGILTRLQRGASADN